MKKKNPKGNTKRKAVIAGIIILVIAAGYLTCVYAKDYLPFLGENNNKVTLAQESKKQTTTRSTSAASTAKTTEKEPETSEIASTKAETTTAPQKETTTEKAAAYKEKMQTVYAKRDVNVRKGPSTSYEKVGVLAMGESVKRLAVGDNGWSRVEFKGEEHYVSSSYLTDEKPEEIKRTVVRPDENNKLLIVVNAYREYDRSYQPKLKKICPGSSYNVSMDCDAADAFTEMYNAAKADGITLYPISGYRTYERQERNYKNRVALWQSRGYSYNEAVQRTREVILPPGTSEHNLGLAMDIGSLSNDFDKTDAYAWLDKHAAEYGFILRYRAEWYDQTGVTAEPWHWRYVGKENAPKIKESGLSLEDYLGIKR